MELLVLKMLNAIPAQLIAQLGIAAALVKVIRMCNDSRHG